MIYWGKSLPKFSIDVNEYRPFIKNDWFRKNYMFFAYGLMIILFITSWCIGIYRKLPLYVELVIFLVVYIVHESLHIITVCTKGDLYLTHSGLYFWLTPDAVLPKGRFWIFITLPLLVLTGVTGITGFFVSGPLSDYLFYIAWINSIIAGSDIINSFLIAIKPSGTVYYRGYYKKESGGMKNE